MYPAEELNRLAWHKAALQRDIARRRRDCAEAASRVVQPLEWLDRAVAFWRKLSPFTRLAAVPLGIVLKRTLLPRAKIFGALVRWAPLAFGVFRSMRAAAAARNGTEHIPGPAD
jgi:hypothetical protein